VFGGPITLFPKHSRRPATPRHNTADPMTALDTSSNSAQHLLRQLSIHWRGMARDYSE
jgi:hypothetical protein